MTVHGTEVNRIGKKAWEHQDTECPNGSQKQRNGKKTKKLRTLENEKKNIGEESLH